MTTTTTLATTRAEFRRGWRPLLGAMIGLAAGIPALPVYTNALFVKPLEAEFGWSRPGIALAATLSILAVAFISPLLGRLADRAGERNLAVAGLVCVAAGFAALATIGGSLLLFILLHIVLAVLGAGSSPVTLTRAVNRWFSRARGLALGLALAGIGITATIAPTLVSLVIQSDGWRLAYCAIAIFALLAAVLVWFLLSDDQRTKTDVSRHAAPSGLSSSDARKTPIFWRLFIAFLLLAVSVSGFVLHFTPMLLDSGMAPARAAAIQGALGISVLSGRLVIGWLVDRFFAPRIAIIMLVIAISGISSFALGGTAFALPAALALGFVLGAEVDLIAYMCARYFGMRSYGAIYGWQYGAFMVGSAISPLAIAWIAAAFGYGFALALSVGLMTIVTLLLAGAPVFPASAEAAPEDN